MNNILEVQGFEFETGGGGCQILSCYMESGAFVWATCLDGGGLPESDNWMICAYGDDIDDIIYEIRSDYNKDTMSLVQAAALALDIASDFESAYATCRNGRPIADCDCC